MGWRFFRGRVSGQWVWPALFLWVSRGFAGDTPPGSAIAWGDGFAISRGEFESAFQNRETSMTAAGTVWTALERTRVRASLLDHLIGRKLAAARAEAADRAMALTNAAYIQKSRRPTANTADATDAVDASFAREAYDEGLAEAVLVRALNLDRVVTPAAIRAYYESHPFEWRIPERAEGLELVISTRDLVTGQEIGEEQRKEKRRTMDRLRQEAFSHPGAFRSLARRYNEDPATKASGGVFKLERGEAPLEVEAAVFSLPIGELSPVVTSPFGYHLFQVLERHAGTRRPLAEVAEDIRERLRAAQLRERAPALLAQWRAAAHVTLAPDAPGAVPR